MEQWSTPGSFAAWSSALNSQCEPTFLGGDPAALTSGGGGGDVSHHGGAELRRNLVALHSGMGEGQSPLP